MAKEMAILTSGRCQRLQVEHPDCTYIIKRLFNGQDPIGKVPNSGPAPGGVDRAWGVLLCAAPPLAHVICLVIGARRDLLPSSLDLIVQCCVIRTYRIDPCLHTVLTPCLSLLGM